jgi:hypothetical protein
MSIDFSDFTEYAVKFPPRHGEYKSDGAGVVGDGAGVVGDGAGVVGDGAEVVVWKR